MKECYTDGDLKGLFIIIVGINIFGCFWKWFTFNC